MRGNLGSFAAALLVGAVAFTGSASLIAQTKAKAATAGSWRVPRTPDGRPDLQGTWTNATLTPLERPRAMADRAFLTEQEAAALEAQAAGRQANADDTGARQQASARGDVGSYNQFWFDSGSKVLPTRQTSLVVDPPDGRVPVRPEAEARRDDALKRSMDHPEFMSMWDRCVSRGVPGWVIPAGYNNAYQIVQTSDYVVIHSEMIHDARVIPLDGRAPLPSRIRLLEGDSRGRWEGDTLVVETTNFDGTNWIATSAASGRIKGIPQSTALRIVERFTRTAPDRIDYEARIDDPEVFTRPWTLAFPLTREDDYRIYEYACHEGNRAIEGVLSGARYQERTPKPNR
jgi:hypothetical protein